MRVEVCKFSDFSEVTNLITSVILTVVVILFLSEFFICTGIIYKFLLIVAIVKILKFLGCAFVLLVIAGCGSTNNFAGCIVENMQGVQNEQARVAVWRLCSEKHPERYDGLEIGVGNGWFGSTTRDECVAKNGKNIFNENASASMSFACHCLYGEPKYDKEQCAKGRFIKVD